MSVYTISERSLKASGAGARSGIPRWSGNKHAQRMSVYTISERSLIVETLKEQGDSRKKAAEQLGLDPATLWRKMKKHGLC